MKKCAYLIVLTALFAIPALASDKLVKLPSKGKAATVTLSSTDIGTGSVTFYLSSKEKTTENFNAQIGANINATAKISYRLISSKSNVATAAKASAGWIPVSMYSGGKPYKSMKISLSGSGTDSGSDSSGSDGSDSGGTVSDGIPTCGCLSESEIEYIMSQDITGMTREEFCASITGDTPPTTCGSDSGSDDGSSDGGSDSSSDLPASVTSISTYGLLEKNTCASYTYIVAIKVDISKATEADFKKGITVSASLKLNEYGGSRAALIKKSDGGVFPNAWIVLMSPVSSYSETINVIQWSGTRIAKRTKLTRGDYAAGFKRMTIGQLLHGGQATFQISTTSGWGATGYSHCFTLSPTRQERGGYHKG